MLHKIAVLADETGGMYNMAKTRGAPPVEAMKVQKRQPLKFEPPGWQPISFVQDVIANRSVAIANVQGLPFIKIMHKRHIDGERFYVGTENIVAL